MSEPDLPDAGPAGPRPHLGLVCITFSDEVRYRTITRTRYLALPEGRREETLRALYQDNLDRFLRALGYCAAHGIRLYRVTSNLFPMSDLEDGVGAELLVTMAPLLALVGPRAEALGVRVVIHPDQFVVLSSDSPSVVESSARILAGHAHHLDLMGLARSSWTAMNIHGGKGGRSERLIETISGLPDPIRARLTLENDERAYGAAEILSACRRAGVPMVFDAHHHLVKERLAGYEDPSVAAFTTAARETWPQPGWQIVHLSNGRDSIGDPRHHELIAEVPSAFVSAPWIEVEAKHKELAIERLRRDWPLAD